MPVAKTRPSTGNNGHLGDKAGVGTDISHCSRQLGACPAETVEFLEVIVGCHGLMGGEDCRKLLEHIRFASGLVRGLGFTRS